MWQFFDVFPLSIFSVLRLTQIEAKKNLEQFLAAGVGGSRLYGQIRSYKTQNLTISDFSWPIFHQHSVLIFQRVTFFPSFNRVSCLMPSPYTPRSFAALLVPTFHACVRRPIKMELYAKLFDIKNNLYRPQITPCTPLTFLPLNHSGGHFLFGLTPPEG